MLVERVSPVANAIAENLRLLDGGTVGLDIDAVTQATHTLALNYVNRILRTSVQKDDLVSYWELVRIAMEHGQKEEEAWELARRAWNRHETYSGSPPVPGARTLLIILRDLRIPHVFLSSRPLEFFETTKGWFSKTFPWINPEDIILGRQRHGAGGDFKVTVINDKNIHLHIEDAPEEALVIVKNTSAKVLMVPQPWNVNEPIDDPNIKLLGPYSDNAGVWPVLRFLAGKEVKDFLAVAQY